MGLLNVIRRMALREQLPIREISRRTGLSRNTIAKYLNAGTIEPKFTTPDRPSKLDPFADKLAGFLAPTSGGVVLNGHAVTGPDKERGMDFQHGALFEWMNVRDNVSFGPRMAGQRRSD